jgi:hypothetical protein
MGGATMPVVPTFVNYELTGTWPALVARTAAGPIKQTPGALAYKMVQVQDQFLAESCAIADYNHDGTPDISSGRRWYEGPDFTQVHIFRGGHDALPRAGVDTEVNSGVSDDWADYPYDLDGDGWTDIIDITNPYNGPTDINPAPSPQPVGTGYWYKNPGTPANETDNFWTAYVLSSYMGMQEHGLADVDGDGKPEIFGACLPTNPPSRGCPDGTPGGYASKGYHQADWSNPMAPWTFHTVTRPYAGPFGGSGLFNGIGMGDINGDGKPDLLEISGAWLQPATLPDASVAWGGAAPLYAGSWVPTVFAAPGYYLDAANSGPLGGSQMFAYDVDGDGLTDVISADAADGWGLSWYQQLPPGVGSCLGATTTETTASPSCFVKHLIMNTNSLADLALYNVAFSELHAVQLVDMDGDGLPDIITGKDWLADGYNDPDSFGTPVVYVFKLVRDANPPQAGKAHFEPHLVNAAVQVVTPVDAGAFPASWTGGSGVGRQIAIGQINPQTDGIMDICVASKLGLFVYLGQ